MGEPAVGLWAAGTFWAGAGSMGARGQARYAPAGGRIVALGIVGAMNERLPQRAGETRANAVVDASGARLGAGHAD